MKRFLLALLLIPAGLFAQTTLWTESFETDGEGVRYNSLFTFNDGPGDHFGRTDGSDISNTFGSYNFYNGTFFIAGED